jgi:hypothetical protein
MRANSQCSPLVAAIGYGFQSQHGEQVSFGRRHIGAVVRKGYCVVNGQKPQLHRATYRLYLHEYFSKAKDALRNISENHYPIGLHNTLGK